MNPVNIETLLEEGRNVHPHDYYNHLRTYNIKTFYYFVKALVEYPKGTSLQSSVLQEKLVQFLEQDFLEIGVQMGAYDLNAKNAHGWFGRSWTERKISPEYWRDEFEEILERDGHPYRYGIKTEYYDAVKHAMSNIQSRKPNHLPQDKRQPEDQENKQLIPPISKEHETQSQSLWNIPPEAGAELELPERAFSAAVDLLDIQPEPGVQPVSERHRLDVALAQHIESSEQRFASSGVFDPKNLDDARERCIRAIVRRRGQPEFRRRLLHIYNNACVVTGANFPEALEAAHILPYKGEHTNHISNGLLLRGDIHTLFDLRLLTIDVETSTVLLAPVLQCSSYADLHGKQVVIPDEQDGGPSKEALRQHRQECGLWERQR